MQRLNIPLDRSIHATRPYRRVVWLLALITPPLAAFFMAGWWFERTDIGTMVPEGTELVVRLQPGKNGWGPVLQAIGHLTAISDRALTLRTLASYSAGEIIIYVDKTGRRSAAIRTKESQIPHTLLDTYGIAVQASGSGLIVLTDRLRPTEKISLPRPSPWIGRGRIGVIYLKTDGDWEAGTITASKEGWSIRLPRQSLPKNQLSRLPTGTVAFLATPVSTTEIEISGVTERMESILAPFELPSLDLFGKELLKNEGGIAIVKHENTFAFLLGGKGANLGEAEWGNILRAAAAFQHPKTQPWTLSDGTKAEEIRVDPSTVTLEERTVLGSKVLQARPTPTETLLLALQTDGRYALSNNESLLMDWLGQKSAEHQTERTCERGHPSAYMDLETLYAFSSSDLTFHQPNLIRDLSQTFHTVALKNNWFSSVFLLCF